MSKKASSGLRMEQLRQNWFIFSLTLLVAFCSIVYELIFSQALTVIFGGTVIRYSMTIGLYLFSLGIGAFLYNWILKRSKKRNQRAASVLLRGNRAVDRRSAGIDLYRLFGNDFDRQFEPGDRSRQQFFAHRILLFHTGDFAQSCDRRRHTLGPGNSAAFGAGQRRRRFVFGRTGFRLYRRALRHHRLRDVVVPRLRPGDHVDRHWFF